MPKDKSVSASVTKKYDDAGKQIDIAGKIGPLLADLLKEPLQELSGIITDRLKFARWSRLVEIQECVYKILRERGVSETRRVPPKLAIPLLEEASLEDDDELKNIWNNLLANAMDPSIKLEFRRSYIEILRSLAPVDVRIIKLLYDVLQREGKLNKIENITDYSLRKEQIISELGLGDVIYQVSAYNLMRTQCISSAVVRSPSFMAGDEMMTFYKGIDAIVITPLGVKFVQACS